jgi:ABC-type lipoprotein release transport system permease subunit
MFFLKAIGSFLWGGAFGAVSVWAPALGELRRRGLPVPGVFETASVWAPALAFAGVALMALTAPLQVWATLSGREPAANFSLRGRQLLFDRRARFVLFGLQALLLDFVLVVVTLLAILALQAVGVLRRVPLSYNVRNLVVRWRISLITALAFTLVVGLLTVMTAFVNGMYELTKGSAVPGNVIVMADGSTDELFSDLGFSGNISALESHKVGGLEVIDTREAELAGKKEKVKLFSWELYQVATQPIANAPPGGRQRRFVQMRGVEEPAVAGMVHDLPLKSGQWFDPAAGVKQVGNESCIQGVLGEGIAREMGHDQGKPSLEVGDTFELGPRRWVVVGIMNSAGRTYDSEVWGKRDLIGKMFRKETRSTAVLRVRDLPLKECVGLQQSADPGADDLAEAAGLVGKDDLAAAAGPLDRYRERTATLEKAAEKLRDDVDAVKKAADRVREDADELKSVLASRMPGLREAVEAQRKLDAAAEDLRDAAAALAREGMEGLKETQRALTAYYNRRVVNRKGAEDLEQAARSLRKGEPEKARTALRAFGARVMASDLSNNFKNPRVRAQSEEDYFDNLNGINRQFLFVIIVVAVFMAVGGVFGVMNTMYAAISQRTRDIAVLRILGYSRLQLLTSFFLESLLMAALGGLLGVALGSVCHGWSATSIISSGQGGGKSVVLHLTVDARIVLGGLGFSLVMGCVGGLLPALSAMRLKPLDALRG